jgi:nucleoside-diphosphate-sugar epimerase
MADPTAENLAPCPELDISAYADSFDRVDNIIDVTRSFLRSATASGNPHVILVSSAMVYGAWPNSPVPVSEDAAVRPVPSRARTPRRSWSRGGRRSRVVRPRSFVRCPS